MAKRRRVYPRGWVAAGAMVLGVTTALLGSAPVASAATTPSWKVVESLPKLASLNSVACASRSMCVVVGQVNANDGAVYETTNGGTTWKAEHLPSGTPRLLSVECPTVRRCEAVGFDGFDTGQIIATTNGGTTWKAQPTLRYSEFLSVDCASASHCEVVGQNGKNPAGLGGGVIAGTTNAGKHWTKQHDPTVAELSAVHCRSTTACIAAGGGEGAVTTNGGRTWVGTDLPGGAEVSDIACPERLTCLAAATNSAGSEGELLRSTDFGAQWTVLDTPSSLAFLGGVSCATSSLCVAVGYNTSAVGESLTTENQGLTWQVESAPAPMLDDWCVKDGTCIAVADGKYPQILRRS